jgi:hypothetical protein
MAVSASNGLVVGITKHLRDECAGGHVAALAHPIADRVVEYLARPNVRELLTRFVTELHAAALDAEARPTGTGE